MHLITAKPFNWFAFVRCIFCFKNILLFSVFFRVKVWYIKIYSYLCSVVMR